MKRDGGFFAVFEGIDGVRKFTQLHATRSWLEGRGHEVAWAREPNDESSAIGKHIRRILRGEIPAPESFEFQRMYVIDRAQNVICFIRPGLADGRIMLWERFAHSTIAYGMLNGLGPEPFIELHQRILGPAMIWPHVTFLLDVSVEEVLRRMAARAEGQELFEKRKQLKRIRANYLDLAGRQQELGIGRIILINGERPEQEVTAEITGILEREFGL